LRSKKLICPGAILTPGALRARFTGPPRFEIGALLGLMRLFGRRVDGDTLCFGASLFALGDYLATLDKGAAGETLVCLKCGAT